MHFVIGLFLLCVMLAVPALRVVALLLLFVGGLAIAGFVSMVNADRIHVQAYEQGQHQLALACGLSDMELETGSGQAGHWQCLSGVRGSDLIWNGQCGSADNRSEAWARCIAARYVKRCEFKLSQHAETWSDGSRVDMLFDECKEIQALKLWASN